MLNSPASETAKSAMCDSPASPAAAPHAVGVVASSLNVSVSVDLDAGSKTALLTLTGPDDGGWFGVGFNASSMAEAPWTIVIDGKTGHVSERALGMHQAGTLIASSVAVVSNTVTNGVRKVRLSRSLQGLTDKHFSFDAASHGFPLIVAHGNTPTIGYHGASRTSVKLSLAQMGTNGSAGAQAGALCLCRDPNAVSGYIDGNRFDPKFCAAEPVGDLLATNNSICNISIVGSAITLPKPSSSSK